MLYTFVVGSVSGVDAKKSAIAADEEAICRSAFGVLWSLTKGCVCTTRQIAFAEVTENTQCASPPYRCAPKLCRQSLYAIGRLPTLAEFRRRYFAGIAQMAERHPRNVQAAGSIPASSSSSPVSHACVCVVQLITLLLSQRETLPDAYGVLRTQGIYDSVAQSVEQPRRACHQFESGHCQFAPKYKGLTPRKDEGARWCSSVGRASVL